MRYTIFSAISLLLLAACNPASAPQSAASAETAATEAAQGSGSGAGRVVVDGRTYRVSVSDDRSVAIVGNPSRRGTFTGRDVEAAATAASGCDGQIVPGEWAMLGDLGDFDLSNLRPNESRPFRGWRVTLTC